LLGVREAAVNPDLDSRLRPFSQCSTIMPSILRWPQSIRSWLEAPRSSVRSKSSRSAKASCTALLSQEENRTFSRSHLNLQQWNATEEIFSIMSTAIQNFDTFVSADVLSIAVISPDEGRRDAAMRSLGECHGGHIQEFTSYPADLSDLSREIGNDYDVILVGLDSDPEYACDVVENLCADNSISVMAYSSQTRLELAIRFMRAGASSLLCPCFTPTWLEPSPAFPPAARLPLTAEKRRGNYSCFLAPKAGAESLPLPPISPWPWLRSLVKAPS